MDWRGGAAVGRKVQWLHLTVMKTVSHHYVRSTYVDYNVDPVFFAAHKQLAYTTHVPRCMYTTFMPHV